MTKFTINVNPCMSRIRDAKIKPKPIKVNEIKHMNTIASMIGIGGSGIDDGSRGHDQYIYEGRPFHAIGEFQRVTTLENLK